MAKDTRERLVRAAHDLFYAEGFHTVGLDRILAEVGVTKTTFYNHFESKDDLVQATLELHDRWWRDTFMRMLRERGGDRPRDQLLAAFDVIEEILSGEDYNGCFFINVAVQFPNPHDPAHAAARRHKQTMEDIIRELAGYAGADDAAAFAKQFCLLMEGAYVTAQMAGDAEAARTAREMAGMLVERWMPSGAGAAPKA